MSDPNDLQAFLAEAWDHLEEGVANSASPARFPTFATVSTEGVPQSRTVVLRAADSAASRLEVHTDRATPKIAELQHQPIAALHIWLPDANLQIRMTTQVDILTGDDVEGRWQKVPVSSRVSYGTEPVPGTPIAHVFDYKNTSARDRFAVLSCTVIQMDLVHLGPQHRRALFAAQDGWIGTWCAP